MKMFRDRKRGFSSWRNRARIVGGNNRTDIIQRLVFIDRTGGFRRNNRTDKIRRCISGDISRGQAGRGVGWGSRTR